MKNDTIQQTKRMILHYIVEQNLQPGQTLPSIRQLQTVLLISKNAALETVQNLCNEGYLKKGSGTRNGYTITKLPEDVTPVSSTQPITAQFMLPFNSWNYVGNRFLTSVEKEFTDHGGSLILNNTENSPGIENRLLRALLTAKSAQPDILLMMPSQSMDYPNLELLRLVQQRIPVVLIDRVVRDFSCCSIALDNRFVGYDAVRRLWNRGCRDFAFVSGFSVISPIQERLSGFMDAIREFGCSNEPYVFLDPSLDMGSYHRIHLQVEALGKKILEQMPRPQGIVCGSDRIATCLVNYFLDCGISVPDQIAVIGCDGDSSFSDFCKVPLCSYRQPFDEMAASIYEVSHAILNGKQSVNYRIAFPPIFLEGNSI